VPHYQHGYRTKGIALGFFLKKLDISNPIVIVKRLEFRSVAVMACDDEIIPLQERIETVGDDADLQEVYNTERHLLYIACTRCACRKSNPEDGGDEP
jgi:hypothetical protein